MNQVPTPLTLSELISCGAIEGSEAAYHNEKGFDYSDPDSSLLYYAGKPLIYPVGHKQNSIPNKSPLFGI